MGAGQNLRVAQGPQAARGATRPDDYAIYARHGVRPSPRPAVAGNSDDQDPGAGSAAISAGTVSRRAAVTESMRVKERPAPVHGSPRGRSPGGSRQPVHQHRAIGCLTGAARDREAAMQALSSLRTDPRRTNPRLRMPAGQAPARTGSSPPPMPRQPGMDINRAAGGACRLLAVPLPAGWQGRDCRDGGSATNDASAVMPWLCRRQVNTDPGAASEF